MPKRVDLGTDIAMIGVWDPAQDHSDLRGNSFEEDLTDLQSKAEAGHLFFINTGGDGGFPTDIYVDEEPDPKALGLYNSPGRAFLIESRSGRLIAGGLEDFGNSHPVITTQEDEFAVNPGRYALRFYELDDEAYFAALREHIGDEDMDYYDRQLGGLPLGCLLFLLAAVSAALAPWPVAVGLGVLWLAYTAIRLRRRAADRRYFEISDRIGAYEKRFPPFIYVLCQIPPGDDVQGGWHDLF